MDTVHEFNRFVREFSSYKGKGKMKAATATLAEPPLRRRRTSTQSACASRVSLKTERGSEAGLIHEGSLADFSTAPNAHTHTAVVRLVVVDFRSWSEVRVREPCVVRW